MVYGKINFKENRTQIVKSIYLNPELGSQERGPPPLPVHAISLPDAVNRKGLCY